MVSHQILEKINAERWKYRPCEDWGMLSHDEKVKSHDIDLMWRNAFDECYPVIPATSSIRTSVAPVAEPELSEHQKMMLEFKAKREKAITNGMKLKSFSEVDDELSILRGDVGAND